MQTVIITGGTGLIGTELSKMLVSKNYRVIIFSRKQKQSDANVTYAVWDPEKLQADAVAISQADYIVNLAGEGVADKRWSRKRKKQIVDSRVNSGRTLVKALQDTPNKVQAVISASGIGWYGPDRKGHAPFKESDPAYNDFLGETCVQWEQSVEPVKQLGKRLVILRTGIVLSNEGGAYPEFKKPMRGGVAGILGSGKQRVSWIHIHDLCRAYVAAIENENMQGVYNASAPEVVTNKQLVLAIAKIRKRPYLPVHVPSFALKIALGEMSVEVLKSTTVDDAKLKAFGFQFVYPSVEAAVRQLENRQ